MRAQSIISLIESRFKAGNRRALHIVGSAGLGKTQIVSQAAAALGVAFRVLHAPLMQPEDYGFPVVSADKTDVGFLVSKAKFPLIGSDCPDSGILLIDELPQADASGQKILANLIQAREIHGHEIKPGWLIVSTGNRVTDRAGANRLLSHLNDRLTVIQFDASLDDWTAWALAHEIPVELIAFLRFRPDLLSNFSPDLPKSATPRSWSEGVAQSLGKVEPEHEYEIYAGDVGEGPAAELCKFLKIFRTLPNPELILLNPDKVDVPSDLATLYALCGALAHKVSKDNFGRLMTYVKRMPPEFSILFVSAATKRCPEVVNTKDYVSWALTDGKNLLI